MRGELRVLLCYTAAMTRKVTSYRIVVERDEDGLYTASVPALPGCHTQAKDVATLHRRTKEAISVCLDALSNEPAYRRRVKELAYEPTFIGVDVVAV